MTPPDAAAAPLDLDAIEAELDAIEAQLAEPDESPIDRAGQAAP